ncbi:ABC transporter permease subunit [Rhodococcus sp. 3Y1]
MLVTIFAVLIPVLPAAGFTTWPSLILPTVTIAILQIALISRMVRREMVSAFASPYITVARSRGVSERELTWRYAMRNSAIPIVTALGTRFAGMLNGVVVVEVVFAWPGVGSLVVRAPRLATTRSSRPPCLSPRFSPCSCNWRWTSSTPPGSTRATRKGRQLMTTVLEPPTTPRASAVTEADFARAGATRRKRDSRAKIWTGSICALLVILPVALAGLLPCRSEPDQPEQSTATASHRRPSFRHRSVGTRSAHGSCTAARCL